MAPSLPPELLLDILEGGESSTLRSAALVESSWATPAQFLLHRNLVLLSPTALKAFAGGVQTRRPFPARKLHLLLGTQGEEGLKVLDQARGIKELLLKSERRKMDASVLQRGSLSGMSCFALASLDRVPSLTSSSLLPLSCPSPNPFSDLTDLRLEGPFAPCDDFDHPLPFSLTAFTIRGLYSSVTSALLAALVDCSAATLTTLDIDCYGPNTSATTLFTTLLPLAPQLLSLELHGSDRRVEPIIPFLAAAQRLTTFTCWEPTFTLLRSLPTSVRTLNIGANFTWAHDVSKDSYEEMLDRSGLLGQLKSVEFSGISMYTLKAQRGGAQLLAECERRKIEVTFGVASLSAYGVNCT